MRHRFAPLFCAAMTMVVTTFVAPVEAAFPDHIRNISGVNYTFKDYSYYATASTFNNMQQLGRLYVPDNYDPNESYPIVVFMHGAGQNGTNNTNQVNSHINNLIKAARTEGFLLYAPQAPYTYYSDDMYQMVQNAVARASHEYNVDTTRIYATGLSMGGGAMKWMMQQYPQLYAAYAPLSTPNNLTVAEANTIKHIPAWYFHGRTDGVTSPVQSDLSVRSLVQAQGGPFLNFPTGSGAEVFYEYGTTRYTQYRDYGHDDNVWNNGAYNKPALYDWMLDQQSDMADLVAGKSVSVNLITAPVGDPRSNTLSTDAGGKTWNTIGRDGTYRAENIALGFASDTTGKQTNTSVFVSKAFGNIGTNVPAGVTAYGQSSLSAGYWMTKPNQAGELEITGLTPGMTYDLNVFASIVGSNYKGLYTVDGQSLVLDASNNLNAFALFTGVTADVNGSLFLSVAPTGGSTYAVLNAFNLTAVPEPGTIAIGASAALLLLRRHRLPK